MTPPIIALTGSPPWQDDAARLLDGLGYRLVGYDAREGYVPRLAEDHAALVLVDGDAAGWAFWTTTPKASPATRRIPVVVVTSDAGVRTAARVAGADVVVAPGRLLAELPALVEAHARVYPDDAGQALARACAEPLPEKARRAIDLFNAGAYYEQHDLLEELWMEHDGPARELYRAILQVGVAYYQVTRGNLRGAHKILLRSLQWLHPLPDVCQGVDVARLRADVARLRDALDALPANAPPEALAGLPLGKVTLAG